MTNIILESDTYQKKYKCPYCDKRDTRMNLVSHIEKKHSDMIPNGYTATRIVFNMINKKEHGTCVICGKETKWDENKARYDRFCGSKACHDKYVKIAHNNTNIEEKLKDPEFQQKMLAGRSISGTYKFSDGGKVSYTGSYERQLLEFLDKILNVKSYDVESPGPVIDYEYKGQTHKWITDQRYIPYNLVFDVKDGGDNPNRREMTEYREKQIAKEAAIKKQGKYNYIRLTNNDFEQLIEVMIELKESLQDTDALQKPIIKINESATATINAMPVSNPNDVYIIDYMKRNTFVDNDDTHHYALCRDYMQDAVTVKDSIMKDIPFEELMEMSVRVYRYIGDANYSDIIDECIDENDIYKVLTGKDLLDEMQLEFDPLFEEVLPYTTYLNILSESLYTTVMQSIPSESSMICEGVNIPYFELEQYNDSISSTKFYRDMDGIFLMNESTGFRTKSYSNIEILKKFKNDISNILV